jgi:hypothetical protein
LAATSAALAAGEIDPDAAHRIARAAQTAPAGAVPLIEPHALEVARTAPVREVAGLLRRFEEVVDPDGADGAALRRYQRRGVSAGSTLDGMVGGRLLLDEVAGAEFLTAAMWLSRCSPATPEALLSGAPMRWARSARTSSAAPRPQGWVGRTHT